MESAGSACSKMWWHVNLFWFHTGCDVFSGYYQAGWLSLRQVRSLRFAQVMPVLTELYTRMSLLLRWCGQKVARFSVSLVSTLVEHSSDLTWQESEHSETPLAEIDTVYPQPHIHMPPRRAVRMN